MNEHTVYIAYHADGHAIYVGRTSKGERRLRQHGKASQWWPLTSRVELLHYATPEEAAMREAEFIHMFRPEYNIERPSAMTRPPEWSDEMLDAFKRRNPRVTIR